MAYENFKRIIPTELQEKIKNLAESVEFREIISGYQESIAEQEIFPIEGNYRDGWMPLQDGGFSVDQFYRSDVDSTYHFTQKQTEYMLEQYKHCLDQFIEDNNLDFIDYDDNEICEQLSEYENEWFEPALLQFQVFVESENKFNNGSPFNVVCRLSINYKDAPYYREKHAEDILFRVYDYREFMNTENSVIVNQFRI